MLFRFTTGDAAILSIAASCPRPALTFSSSSMKRRTRLPSWRHGAPFADPVRICLDPASVPKIVAVFCHDLNTVGSLKRSTVEAH